MPTINRASGLQIDLPDDYQLDEPTVAAPSRTRRAGRGSVSGAIPMPTSATTSAEDDLLIAALERQEMELFDQFEVTPGAASTTRATRATRAAKPRAAAFTVPLAANEDAVLLLEQDGMYTWQFPTAPAAAAPAARGMRRSAAPRQVTFRIELPGTAAPAPTRASARRGIVSNFVFGKVKGYVLKFAARIAVGGAIKFLERNVRVGVINMGSADPQHWALVGDPASLKLPLDRPARILLFIHGTFSSTIGGFGALAATPWGAQFMEGARANYDAIIGFDHPTLSEDPFDNANELLKALQQFRGAFPPQIDIVTHSRGGLVTRSLIERLLPASPWKPQIGRVVFVAATNGGTQLATPDNWQTLVDLYTNLIVGACKLLKLLPSAAMAAVILGEAVQSLGAFVKYAATHTLTDGGVPGLAAMQPDGPFVTEINETQPGQPTIQQSFYCAVTSQFKAKLSGDHQPSELPQRLLQMLGTGFISKLMGEENDLVVNTAAMTAIDPQAGKFIKDSLDFAANPQIYHTNYFVQPKVVDALTRWLDLMAPPATVPVTARRGTTRGATRSARPSASAPGSLAAIAARRRVTPAGTAGAVSVPAAVDTDIIVIDADFSAAELRRLLEARMTSFVVVRRVYSGEVLHYAFKSEEALPAITPKDQRTVLDALNLHESDASATRTVSDEMAPPQSRTGSPTKRRTVVTEFGQPVGVLPETIELLTAEQLAELARKVTAPKRAEERAQAQRAMPTFSTDNLLGIPMSGTAIIVDAPPTRGGTRSARGGLLPDSSTEPRPPATTRRSATRAPRAAYSKIRVPPSVGVTRSKPRNGAPPAPAKVTCHFHAEMDQEVIVKRTATVEVTVAREVIERTLGAASVGGTGEVATDRKIVIQAIPKKNFELKDEDRAEIDPPQPGAPAQLYFDLKATNAGDGEVWIVARQGQVPLVTLQLKPQVVKTKSSQPAKASAAARDVSEATPLKASLHELDIIELERGNQRFFRYELESPELGLREVHESKPFVGDRAQYVAELYKKIEERWLTSEEDFDNFTEELRAFGGELFDELIPEKLQRTLWEHRDKIRSIRVISTEPFIPWELLHLKEPGQPLPAETKFLGQMGLVRWLNEAGFYPPDRLLIRKGRARYVAPEYPHPDYVLAETKEEAKFLKAKFGATPIAPKSAEVRKVLSKPGEFDLLHFACHGAAESNNITGAQLLMEGRVENGQYIIDALPATVAEQYANLKGPDNRPMIVLNACQTGRAGYELTGLGGFAQAFLKRGAGVFVGALWSVGDSPARSFTEEFYEQLLKGAPIAEATIKAREKARQAGEATWLAYVVYGHPHLQLG